MKKILFVIIVLFAVACKNYSQEENRAERLVKVYLDSLNRGITGYEILGYNDLHANYTTIEDDPNYEKYEDNPAKLDSIKGKFSPKIRAWVIYVTFKGKDSYGNLGKHVYQCAFNKSLSKFIVGIEVDNISRSR